MKGISINCPAEFLAEAHALTGFSVVMGDVAVESSTYASAVASLSGGVKMLDNGFFYHQKSLDLGTLYSLAEQLGCGWVILPDGEGIDDITASLSGIPSFIKRLYFVPTTTEQLRKCLMRVSDGIGVGISHLHAKNNGYAPFHHLSRIKWIVDACESFDIAYANNILRSGNLHFLSASHNAKAEIDLLERICFDRFTIDSTQFFQAFLDGVEYADMKKRSDELFSFLMKSADKSFFAPRAAKFYADAGCATPYKLEL